jgi:hypothetical protein
MSTQVAELPNSHDVSPDEPDETVQSSEPPVRYSEPGQFEYRPVPVLAVVGCVLGVLSAMALLGLTGIVVAFLGLITSGYAIMRIRAARGDLGGQRLALLGLGLSVVFLSSGVAWQRYQYLHEVPDGYVRTSFTEDIARKGFVTVEGQTAVHPDIQTLVDQPLFLKGFMYPTGQMEGLDSFLLVKDSGTCCFGGEPAIEDMIGVVMEPGQTVDYYQGRVSVAGTFELNPRYTGQKLEPIFLMKGQIVTKSRTAF